MKVLMPTIFYPHIGGITIHVENIIKRLKDIEFHILTYDYYEPKYNNVVIHQVPHLKRMRGLTYLINAIRIGKEILKKEDIDLIHSHYAFPQGCVGSYLRKYCPHILTLHGSDVLFLRKSFLGRLFFNYSLRGADKIICVSKYLASQIDRESVVIYNGVDEGKNLGDHGFGLYVGSFVKQKGLDLLLKAIEGIDFKFKIIGGLGKNRENIEYLGKLSHEETLKYMGMCSFLVVPSRVEGFGIVALEAMACEKPVIAMNTGGLREIVINGYNGFLVNDVKEMREKIKLLIEDEDLRKELGRNAKKFSKKFSWEKTVKKVREVYEEILWKD
ncbi:glycosyltransferase family 4 protein [Methanocaldococcus infernus]|nr:glycosyltransferase family 4 protein [Methanocaldococcus infernus]